MHIPDGYLSPATCAVAYAAVMPFWYVAMRKVESQLHTRMVPLLAVFSAFSFVVMMFNLPLPGGTTGHAVGLAIAAVVLGPWGGMLAISIALAIQAFFFGDGGISTLGANCLNMGCIGVGVAYLIYRALSGNVAIDSPRRVVAATVAGYVAINVAALATAIEFGVQPMWFHTEAGVPLYAPYPLEIAIPAMMIGHLGVAGIAEGIVSGGLLSWLQRAEPDLLRATAFAASAEASVDGDPGWFSIRKLLGLLGVLMVLAPLGQLASGTAWGEWSSEDFADPHKREEIVAASGSRALPSDTPEGLKQLSSLWNSPIPDYEVPFLPRSVGYAFSAMLGGGLTILIWLTVGWAFGSLRRQPSRG
jgi:cobalt/nickel transport system permease protein